MCQRFFIQAEFQRSAPILEQRKEDIPERLPTRHLLTPVSRRDAESELVTATKWAVHELFRDSFRTHIYQQTMFQICQHEVMEKLRLVPLAQRLCGLELNDRSRGKENIEEICLRESLMIYANRRLQDQVVPPDRQRLLVMLFIEKSPQF